jgi:hypothetical protein
MGDRAEQMTEYDLWLEEIWDKLQQCIYIVDNGGVYDFESGEYICEIKLIKPD